MAGKRASDLGPGDVVLYSDHKLPVLLVCKSGCYRPMDVRVAILRGPEPVADVTGLPVVRLWARREDTGAEGFIVYGPAAEVPLAVGGAS